MASRFFPSFLERSNTRQQGRHLTALQLANNKITGSNTGYYTLAIPEIGSLIAEDVGSNHLNVLKSVLDQSGYGNIDALNVLLEVVALDVALLFTVQDMHLEEWHAIGIFENPVVSQYGLFANDEDVCGLQERLCSQTQATSKFPSFYVSLIFTAISQELLTYTFLGAHQTKASTTGLAGASDGNTGSVADSQKRWPTRSLRKPCRYHGT